MNCLSGDRWNAQLKGLAKLKKRSQNEMQEVKFLGDRQEILNGMIEDKIRLQSRATERHHDQIFEEIKELDEKKSEEAVLICAENGMIRDLETREV